MASTPNTVVNTAFGAPGVSDPIMFHPGLVGIRRHVNFGVTNLTASTFYALFGLPKAFVPTGIFVEETSKCSASTTLTLKIADATDADNDKTLGAAVNVGGSALARATKVGTLGTNSFIVLDEGAIVSLVPGANLTGGAVNIVVYGYTPYGDSLGNVVTPDYRASGQSSADAAANRAGTDPYDEAMVPGKRVSD